MKRHISTPQILREFDEAGKVSVIRYDAEGKRRGTYAGLCLNAAFREVVDASNKGLRVVVVRSEGFGSDMYATIDEALSAPNKIDLPRNFGSRR